MLLKYLFTFTTIITLCRCSVVNVSSISTVHVTLIRKPSVDGPEVEHLCDGGMQLNMLKKDELLLGICSPPPTDWRGVIGTLPLRCLQEGQCDVASSAVTVQYGDISAPAPGPDNNETDWDGTYADATIARPEHLYQTADTIYFVDARSCARKINRNTGKVDTVKGHCNSSGTLDIPGLATGQIIGMTYFEDREMWVVALADYGIYVFSEDTEPRQLVPIEDMSDNVSDKVRQIIRGFDSKNQYNDIVWHRIGWGVNFYNLSKVTATDGIPTFNDTSVVRYISATGSSSYIDVTARRAEQSDPELGYHSKYRESDLSISPDGRVLLITDRQRNRLFFLDLVDEEGIGDIDPLQEVCEKDTSVIDDSVENCTFSAIAGALWIDDVTILVYERSTYVYSGFRLVELLLPYDPEVELLLPDDLEDTAVNILNVRHIAGTASTVTITKLPYYANILLLIMSLTSFC